MDVDLHEPRAYIATVCTSRERSGEPASLPARSQQPASGRGQAERVNKSASSRVRAACLASQPTIQEQVNPH